MKRAGYIFVYLITLVALVSYAGIGMAAKPEGKHQENAQKHQDKQDKMEAKGAGKQHGKGHLHNGKDLVGAKIKTNGHHVLEKNGAVTASIEVKDGKIAGLNAKHDKKGDLAVKKYKTNKQMAQTVPLDGIARSQTVQDQYLGTVYIGYAYEDDYGDEQIYWFPYDMILDGDTGAVDYYESMSS